MDISTVRLTTALKWSSQATKFKGKDQVYFLTTLSELLSQGFSLHQSLDFLQLLMVNHRDILTAIDQSLGQGTSFDKAIQAYGFSHTIIAQVFFGQRQGRFHESLHLAGQQIQEGLNYRTKFLKTLTYPLLMSCFLVAILLGMRTFMLPHIASFISQETYDTNLLIRLLIGFFTYLPQIFLLIVALGLIAYLVFDFYLMRLPVLRRYQILTRLPLIRYWVRLYASHVFARELSFFYGGGYSIQQITQLLIEYPLHPFLSDLALELEAGLVQGRAIGEIIQDQGIFSDQLPFVIQQGELTSQTAQKLEVYANRVFADLMADIEKKLALIQPILFIIIAVLVMAMYLLMMLPMLTMEV